MAADAHPGARAKGQQPPNGRKAIARVSEEVLPALIARLSASELGELEVAEGKWRVRLRRDATAPSNGIHATPRAAKPLVDGAARPAAVATPPATPPSSRAKRRMATSPAVGYYSPRTGLAIGQNVRAGDTLGHVEVLGMPQPVVAPVDGIVGKLLAQQGQAVEYGQELVRIDQREHGDRATEHDAGTTVSGTGSASDTQAGEDGQPAPSDSGAASITIDVSTGNQHGAPESLLEIETLQAAFTE